MAKVKQKKSGKRDDPAKPSKRGKPGEPAALSPASRSDAQNGARERRADTPTTGVVGSDGKSNIRFSATLYRPAGEDAADTPRARGTADAWTFLTLPKEASRKLPSRGQVTVDGTLNGVPFQATLEPDGQGGHWLKVERKLREAAGAKMGDVVSLEIAPVGEEPEPTVPPDLRKALAAAAPGKQGKLGAQEAWLDITPAARRDFIHWITSPKRPETRVKRIVTACDMLAKGKRRPCCFDRSGMYDKSLSCPVAAPLEGDDTCTDAGC